MRRIVNDQHTVYLLETHQIVPEIDSLNSFAAKRSDVRRALLKVLPKHCRLCKQPLSDPQETLMKVYDVEDGKLTYGDSMTVMATIIYRDSNGRPPVHGYIVKVGCQSFSGTDLKTIMQWAMKGQKKKK